jgi:hypothetical protein
MIYKTQKSRFLLTNHFNILSEVSGICSLLVSDLESSSVGLNARREGGCLRRNIEDRTNQAHDSQ